MQSNTKQLQKAFGRVVRQQRVAKGLSQEEFAEVVGLHRTYIGSVERGERNISLHNIVRLSRALGMHPSQLIKLAETEAYNDRREPP